VVRRRINLPLYGLIVVCVVSFLSPFASVFVSVHMSDRATARALRDREEERARADREQAEATARMRENSRKRTCDLFRVFIVPFEEEPPTTPAAQAMNKQLLQEYRRLECVPPK
jgi:hypothetical protein